MILPHYFSNIHKPLNQVNGILFLILRRLVLPFGNKTCLGIPICYPVIAMGRVLKYNILLAQALIFSSISFGQLNIIDYSLKESRIGPMRFQGVTIRKQIASRLFLTLYTDLNVNSIGPFLIRLNWFF